ncbi:MAG: hypothetical protein WAP03_17900 [Methylorubrum rhodinum]
MPEGVVANAVLDADRRCRAGIGLRLRPWIDEGDAERQDGTENERRQG